MVLLGLVVEFEFGFGIEIEVDLNRAFDFRHCCSLVSCDYVAYIQKNPIEIEDGVGCGTVFLGVGSTIGVDRTNNQKKKGSVYWEEKVM